MKTLFTLFAASFFLCSCVQLSYVGSTYPATQNVDVYVDPSAIKKPYTIIGKSVLENLEHSLSTPEMIQKKAVAMAMKKGADAIMVGDEGRRYEGSRMETVTTATNTGNDRVTTNSSTVTPNITHDRIIFYLKYQ